MTQTYRVELGARSYDIVVGVDLLAQAGDRVRTRLAPSRAAVVADSHVAPLYGERVRASLDAAGVPASLITFPAGEEAKALDQLAALYDRLFAAAIDRAGCIVAVGGGVTGDLAGFAAATFMRGIPFVQVPTSLLAMVDSSSGGKTGVNHPRGKNLIGAFHQPALVLADIGALQTLPRPELLSGLAEVVKHGMIRDAGYFALVQERAAEILALAPEALVPVIAGSCRIKGEVVAADEREADLRPDSGNGCRRLQIQHRYPDDLAARFGEPVGLSHGRRYVPGVGVGHGLHGDRGVTTHRYVAHLDLACFSPGYHGGRVYTFAFLPASFFFRVKRAMMGEGKAFK